jgi:hypothetical protein
LIYGVHSRIRPCPDSAARQPGKSLGVQEICPYDEPHHNSSAHVGPTAKGRFIMLRADRQSRLIGAIAEFTSDDRGLVWPRAVAPYAVHLLALPGGDAAGRAAAIADDLARQGVEVLLDDRRVSAGAMMTDADLIKIPYRVVVSRRGLASGTIEAAERVTGATTRLPADDITALLTWLQQRGVGDPVALE